jgi:hypothetical protein
MLGISLSLIGCQKKKSAADTTSETESTDEAADKQANEKKFRPGVNGERQDADSVAVAGSLALNLTLAGGPDQVLAFRSSKGKYDDVRSVIVSDVDENGKFSLKLPQGNEKLDQIKNAKRADGSFDRNQVSQILGQEIPSDTSDAEIQAHLDEMAAEAAAGGVSYTLVAMKKSGDRVEEATSFKFIGMKSGGAILNGLPISSAKGDIGLGEISGEGDQGTSELGLSEEVFDISLATLEGLSAASKALKIVKNQWMNQHEDGSSYEVTPFYMWKAPLTAARADFTTANSAAFSGMGMYLAVRNTGLIFEDICTPTPIGKALTLTPPVEIIAGSLGTINASNPFSNAGLGAIQTESTRSNCGGSATGFYGAGKPGEQDLMLNWGTGGSITTVPEGIWDFKVADESKAHFELASSSPIDADGNPLVFIPSVKVTMADGAVSKVEVELYRYDAATSDYVKIEDLAAFKGSVSGFNCELGSRAESGSSIDERVSLLENVSGSVMSVSAADYTNKYLDDQTLKVAVYYEMFGGSYRMEVGN